MAHVHDILRRILGNVVMPSDASGDAYDTFVRDEVPRLIDAFEKGGFLEQTKLPAIRSEDELLAKLQQHKDDLVVIKYWKHGCIPCLSLAEMYKAAALRCAREGKRVHWYSVDTKSASARELVEYQLVSGTPMLQTFAGQRQVGEEIRATNMDDLMREIDARIPRSTRDDANHGHGSTADAAM